VEATIEAFERIVDENIHRSPFGGIHEEHGARNSLLLCVSLSALHSPVPHATVSCREGHTATGKLTIDLAIRHGAGLHHEQMAARPQAVPLHV
jgi:hypothetical protein